MVEQDWKETSLKTLEDIRKNKKTKSDENICVRCKREIPEGSNICPFCGRALNNEGRKFLLDFCTRPQIKK